MEDFLSFCWIYDPLVIYLFVYLITYFILSVGSHFYDEDFTFNEDLAIFLIAVLSIIPFLGFIYLIYTVAVSPKNSAKLRGRRRKFREWFINLLTPKSSDIS